MNQIPLFKFGQARIPLNSDTGMSISGSKKYDFLSVFATKNSPQINQYSGIPMIDVFLAKKCRNFKKAKNPRLLSPINCPTCSTVLSYGTRTWVSTICITISLTPNLLLEERKVCVCAKTQCSGGKTVM